MKDRVYFAKQAVRLVRRWEMPEPIIMFDDSPTAEGGEIPLMFCDGLARAFFLSDVSEMLYAAYRRGVRDEQKRRKRKAVRRWLTLREGDAPSGRA
ncbi:hypothetical protein D6833_08620 [Candidatus Parcubacteria bacterium]|nr:MAG: hypothetical protein D6833_08620 [Candidatus Parcubacteria bacterium]